MLSLISKTTSINAVSVINNLDVVGFNCCINSDNTFSISKDIRDSIVYLANKEECESDYNAFETQIQSWLNTENNNEEENND